MRIRISDELAKELAKIKKRDQKLAKQVQKQLEIFSKNPKHPSLRLHKLEGELKNLWSISITKSIRLTYLLEDDEAYLVDIGTHEQVYKK